MENTEKYYIYAHKVRSRPMDGWGRSHEMEIDTLGLFSTKEKAEKAKERRDAFKRDKSKGYHFCDVGESWIEEEIVQ